MNKSVKAALLSAFVYPGLGHFFLKKYGRFAIFSGTFSIPLYFIISDIIEKAEHIVKQIKNGEIPLNLAAISESLSSNVVAANTQELNILLYVLVAIWGIGVIDSYRLGITKR
jgi:hypothetical protein